MRPITKALVLVSLSSCALASLLAACGGGDDTGAIGTDAGDESTTTPPTPPPNPPPPNPPPPPPGNDGGDAGEGGCAPEGSGCLVNGADPGLCKSGSCTTCADPADDNACKAAYGGAVDGGSLVCNQGVCVAGNCHTSTDCGGGKVCSESTCGSCTGDTQCATAYGAGYVCNTTTGGCVTNTTACTNADAGTCSNSAADICCVPAGGTAGTCAPGNCCTDAQCTNAAKPTCVNRVCTGCPAVTDGNYLVDPTVVDDSAATGGPTCPFASITHALAFLGAAQAAPVNVVIKTGTTTFGAKETFPLIVPVNVTVKSADTANPATLQVATSKDGFVLASATSGIDYLKLDGNAHGARIGVFVQTGASSTTTTLKHTTISAFGDSGIVVRNAAGKTTGGGLAIGPGVTVTGSGVAANPADGLRVRDNGIVVITGTATDKTHFDANTGAGIRIDDLGQLTLTGDVGATPPTTGTITASSNAGPNVLIAQTPGTPPANSITGLTAWSSTGGAGIRILGGSTLSLRSSSLLGNASFGIHVVSNVNGTTVTDDVSKIDLGAGTAAGVAGKNVFQAPTGASPNAGAGVCLDITANKGQILMAQGNTFVTKAGATTDCTGATPGQISKNTTCGGGVSIGVIGPAVNTDQIITLNCTQ